MNNSQIDFDNEDLETKQEFLEKERGRLVKILEAIRGVEASEDWQKLKKLLLNGVVETLEKQVMNEVSKPKINTDELYQLKGQLTWAKKYLDLKKLSEWYKVQVENINNLLK